MIEPIERMRKLVNDNLVMGLRFQMNGELNKLESEIEQELNSRAERTCRNVHKEWSKTSFAGAETSFCCSECGAHYVDCESYYAGLADADEEQIRTNYCPNCGCKVVGE